MSQPTAYYPAYNFTQYQASHPNTPLPGASVDSELFSISTSITEICVNLALIQNSDGTLGNQTVGFNQLQSGLTIGLSTPATTWVTAHGYTVNNVVYQNNSLYICAISHTSTVFATDLAAGDWILFINTGQYVTAAAASATAAAGSATTAAGSATAAAASATAAATSATAATAGANYYVGAATGTDTITVTPTTAIGAWVTGLQMRWATAGANATATPTFNPSGIGAKNIKKVNGSGVVTNLAIADMTANSHVEGEYDGTQLLLLNAQPFSQSAAIATASTLNLDNATGVYVPLTGTTTVTAITLALGQYRRCVAGSGFTMNNGASLILPTGANVAFAAGDTFDAFGEASSVVRITNIQRANGNPLALSGIAVTTAALTATGGTIDNTVIGGTTPAAASVTSMNGNQMAGFRNRIINGDFSVWQRGTAGQTLTSSLAYGGPDRWAAVQFTSAAGSVGQNASVPSGVGARFCARVGRNNGSALTNSIVFVQAIETANSISLAGQQVTLSYYAKIGANFSGASNQINCILRTGTGTDDTANNGYQGAWAGAGAPINSNDTLTTSWQRFSHTVTLGSTVSELMTDFRYAPSGTAGADDNFYLWGVQLEPGPVATPFEFRTFATELELCRRYFQKSFPYATTPAQNSGVTGGVVAKNPIANGVPNMWIKFSPSMRVTPTVTTYNPSATNANWRDVSASADVTVTLDHPGAVGESGVSVGSNSTVTTINDDLVIHYSAAAEL